MDGNNLFVFSAISKKMCQLCSWCSLFFAYRLSQADWLREGVLQPIRHL